ncbi:MAG: radical SAM protein [Chloroflexota bacterium]
MLLLRQPSTEEKLEHLRDSARYDQVGSDEASGCRPTKGIRDVSEELGRYLFQPAGRASGPLVKVFLTDACENNCLYCACRAERESRRVAFQPDELASAFMELHRRGRASGLFLSSGLGGNARRTMEEMLRTVEILRHRHHYPGYIHLKILPGATQQYIEAACRLADRVSANLEAPNPDRLAVLCPDKQFHADLESPLHQVARIRRQGPVLPFGHITQFVVGASGENDKEILSTAARLYGEANLTRAYYSAFQPIPDTPLESHSPTPLSRQLRLYQADALLHQYGFSTEELPLDGDGNLPRDRDPKLEWAHRHPERFPLEVNRATREELLRVPGIGPKAADALLKLRRSGRITDAGRLRGLAIRLSRAAPFLLVDGRRLEPDRPQQMRLELLIDWKG